MIFRPMSHSGLLFVLFAHAFFMTGCTGNGRDPMQANEMVIGFSARPKSLDPRLSTDLASARVQQLLYNSLVKKDIHSNLVPDLAERWEMPDDVTYRFFLRENVRFHDGTILMARDVKATFDAILSDELGSLKRAAFEKIASIEIENDHQLVFRTSEPFAPFLINLVQGILPAREAFKLDQADRIEPVGTGPFLLEERQGEEYLVLKAFEDCFSGSPRLDRIIIRVIPDDTIRLMELEKGTIDFLQNNIPPDSIPRIEQNPRFEVVSAPGTSIYYLGFNFRLDYPPRDRRVRQALALALNREDIIRHLLGGNASPATAVIPENHWAYNPRVEQVPFRPDHARELLEEAGYPIRDGSRFSIQFKCSQNKQSRRLAEVIQAQWAQIGVQTDIRSLEWGTFYDDILKGNFESYILSWVGVTDPDIYYSLFHSRSISPNGRNRGQFQSEAMDILLERGRRIIDPDLRMEVYSEVQELAAREFPYINLWHTHNIAVMDHRLQGYRMYPAGDFDSMAVMWWMRPGD
ncbi:ABC transporter substrate-binding protein [bacterium]|nr:ABC transporter substrate-binding protein [candidate division CSSED10-310 bacterium]